MMRGDSIWGVEKSLRDSNRGPHNYTFDDTTD